MKRERLSLSVRFISPAVRPPGTQGAQRRVQHSRKHCQQPHTAPQVEDCMCGHNASPRRTMGHKMMGHNGEEWGTVPSPISDLRQLPHRNRPEERGVARHLHLPLHIPGLFPSPPLPAKGGMVSVPLAPLWAEVCALPGKVDIRLPGNREFKLPWYKAVLLQSSRCSSGLGPVGCQ